MRVFLFSILTLLIHTTPAYSGITGGTWTYMAATNYSTCHGEVIFCPDNTFKAQDACLDTDRMCYKTHRFIPPPGGQPFVWVLTFRGHYRASDNLESESSTVYEVIANNNSYAAFGMVTRGDGTEVISLLKGLSLSAAEKDYYNSNRCDPEPGIDKELISTVTCNP